jgi:hypothetical protein
MYRARLFAVRPRGLYFFPIVLLLFACVALSPARCFAAEDQAAVTKAFEVFQQEWLIKLNQHGDYGWEKIKMETDSQGRHCASYRILTKGLESEVKATGDKGSPYVGVLKYEEQTYASRADTPDLAKQGPFECEKALVVTEIFRYSGGKWLY